MKIRFKKISALTPRRDGSAGTALGKKLGVKIDSDLPFREIQVAFTYCDEEAPITSRCGDDAALLDPIPQNRHLITTTPVLLHAELSRKSAKPPIAYWPLAAHLDEFHTYFTV